MKKLLISLIVLLVSAGSFAQSKSALDQSIEQLMQAKNGATIFTRITESNIKNIETSKQADFQQKVEALAAAKQNEALKYFAKKYSQADINEIYTEFTTEGRIDYTPKTLTFIREWRNFKSQFQQDFKVLYQSL